ncbi:MAG: hypothetical protein V4620_07795 [Bacteroidota bacterium]
MSKLDSIIQLKENIALLERQKANDERMLKEHFKETIAAFSPANLVKSTFHDLVQAPDFKHDLKDAAMGLASGYLTKKILVGGSLNPVKQVAGTLLQMAITSLVSKNADGIKATATALVNKFIRGKKPADQA